MEQPNFKILLEKIQKISEKYDNEDRVTGRRFNIYSIADIETDEVKTHSKMIAELLNPKGSHAQGDKYLKLFCDVVRINPTFSEKIKVTVETSFDNGRLDIELIFEDFYVIIENKINALDQASQITRYYSQAKKKNLNYNIFYLNRYGTEPTAEAFKNFGNIPPIEKNGNDQNDQPKYKCGDEEVELKLISYRETIRTWLEQCREASQELPNIHAGITHYLNLVKKITGDTMSANEREQIQGHLIKNSNDLTIALKISQAFNSPELRGKILYDFFDKLKDKLITDHIQECYPQKYTNLEYNLEACQNWFKRGDKENKWECKGFFLKTKNPNIFIHVEVATSALHYGLITENIDLEKKLRDTIEKPWVERNWPSLRWFSKMKADNINSFTSETILRLTNEEQITEFANLIHRDVNDILGKISVS